MLRLVRRLAVPASVGFLFNTLYYVADTFFAGLLSTDAQAALSRAFPVYFLLIAIGAGLGQATTALIANAVGARKYERAGLFGAQAIVYGAIASVAVSILGVWFAPALFRVMGAGAAEVALGLEYMNTVLVWAWLFVLPMIVSGVLSAQGDTKTLRNVLVGGFFLNLLLNPLFMFGIGPIPGLGVRGLAVATVFIQSLGFVYFLYRMKPTTIKAFMVGWGRYLPRARPARDIAVQALPATLSLLMVAIGFFIVTAYVSNFGEDAVAAFGIGTRIEQIVLLPTIGLNMACLSITGQNYGARRYERVREGFRVCLIAGGVLMTLGACVLLFFGRPLVSLFSQDPEVIDIGTRFLQIECLALWAYMIWFLCVSVLQGLKRPLVAMAIGVIRLVVAPIVAFGLLVGMLGFGLDSIWWSVVAITWIAAIVTFVYTRKKMDRMLSRRLPAS